MLRAEKPSRHAVGTMERKGARMVPRPQACLPVSTAVGVGVFIRGLYTARLYHKRPSVVFPDSAPRG